MIKEITAKVLLSPVKQPDDWFGLKFNMNLYRGCQHQCIYCDSRSECYQIENFKDVLVKVNAIDLLRDEISRKRVKGTIGTGSMNDPYMPLEAKRELTRGALQVIADFLFPVHIVTKSDLVLRDLDLLRTIHQVYAAVSLTITTADDDSVFRLVFKQSLDRSAIVEIPQGGDAIRVDAAYRGHQCPGAGCQYQSIVRLFPFTLVVEVLYE